MPVRSSHCRLQPRRTRGDLARLAARGSAAKLRFFGCSLVKEKPTRAVSANSGAVACRRRRTGASWSALFCQRRCKSKLTEAPCNSEAPDGHPGPHMLRE